MASDETDDKHQQQYAASDHNVEDNSISSDSEKYGTTNDKSEMRQLGKLQQLRVSPFRRWFSFTDLLTSMA
jgi:hypothetical protein